MQDKSHFSTTIFHMAKQPNKDAPSDPLEIDVTDDPNYDWPDTPDEEEQQDDFDQEEDAEEESPDDEPSGDDDQDPVDPEEMLDENGDPKYVSMERFKELQSSWTKGTQKLLGTIKAQQEVFRILPELSDDQSKIRYYYTHYLQWVYSNIDVYISKILGIPTLWPVIVLLVLWTPILLWLIRWYITHRSWSLWPAIICHTLFNGMIIFV